MNYRSPTRHDIGKTVEVSQDGEKTWMTGELRSVEYHDADSDATYWIDTGKPQWTYGWHCRVPYTTADPITELSIAADLLAENGMDEAARVLALVASIHQAQKTEIDRIERRKVLAGGELVVELGKAIVK